MTDHPPYSWMTGFIRGKLNPRKRRAYLAHLILGCEPCRREIAPIAQVMFRPGRASEPAKGGAEYDGPISRAISAASERNQERLQERQQAEANIASGVWGTDSSKEFWTFGLCEVLLEHSARFRHESAREMRRLAKLACEAADKLDPQVYGRDHVLDMRARCWGEYASACRHHDDLMQANWCLERALGLYKQGSGSSLLRARLAEVTGGILTHERQFQAALRALDLSFSLYSRHGQPIDAFRVLMGCGICTGRSGDPEMALLLLSRALAFAEEHKINDPRLRFIALHNILLFRVEHGDFDEAKKQLFRMRPLYALHAGAVDSVKLRGIEARIAAGLGDHERAEKGLLEVQKEFDRRGQVYHAAVMGLEVAALWLRKGRLQDVKQMVARLLDVFRSRHVARESIAALLMLRQALERDRASQDLIRGVASLLELHQGDDAFQLSPERDRAPRD